MHSTRAEAPRQDQHSQPPNTPCQPRKRQIKLAEYSKRLRGIASPTGTVRPPGADAPRSSRRTRRRSASSAFCARCCSSSWRRRLAASSCSFRASRDGLVQTQDAWTELRASRRPSAATTSGGRRRGRGRGASGARSRPASGCCAGAGGRRLGAGQAPPRSVPPADLPGPDRARPARRRPALPAPAGLGRAALPAPAVRGTGSVRENGQRMYPGWEAAAARGGNRNVHGLRRQYWHEKGCWWGALEKRMAGGERDESGCSA
jgi:hypothetical protein